MSEYYIGQKLGYVSRNVPEPIGEGERHWHVVITEHGREFAMAERLVEELQLKPYVPIEHKRVSAGRGRVRDVERAMIPCHLFLPLPLTFNAHRRVRAVRGFSRFLLIDDRKPALLKPAAIAALRFAEGKLAGKQGQQPSAAAPYQIGQRVWAEVLPFLPMLARIESYDARGRANIVTDMEVMGRKNWPLEIFRVRPIE